MVILSKPSKPTWTTKARRSAKPRRAMNLHGILCRSTFRDAATSQKFREPFLDGIENEKTIIRFPR